MTPIVALGLTALGLYGGYKGFQYIKAKKGPTAPVDKLVKGQTYVVLAEFTGVGTADPAAGSSYLKNFFGQSGFTVLDDPKPRDATEAANYAANVPSAWTFKATWNMDSPYVAQGAPNITMATFQPVAS